MVDRSSALSLVALGLVLAAFAWRATAASPGPEGPAAASATAPAAGEAATPSGAAAPPSPGSPGSAAAGGPPTDVDPDGPRTPVPGDLLLTEVMADPACAPDDEGEWVELFNASTHPLDLAGVSLGARRERAVALPPGVPLLAPGAYLLVSRSESAGAAGAAVGAVLPRLSLTNRQGRVGVFHGEQELAALAYGGESSLPVVRGRSLSLDPASYGRDADHGGQRWCAAPARQQGPCGDIASPGGASPPCPRRSAAARGSRRGR